MNAATSFWRLLRQAPPRPLLALLALLTLCTLSEGAGILLLVPLLEWFGAGHARQSWVQPLLGPLGDTPTSVGAGVLLLLFLAVIALRSAAQWGRDRVGQGLQHELVDDLRQRCMAALLGAEWRWLADGRRADHANLLLTEVNRVGMGLQSGLALLAGLASTAACLVAALLLSGSMTLVAMIGGGLVFAALARQRQQAMSLGHALTTANRSMQATVQESLAGIRLAKIFGTEQRHLQQFAETTHALRIRQLGFSAGSSLSQALFQVAGAALLAAFVYAGLVFWHTPLPVLLTLVLIFSRLIPQLMGVHQQLHRWLHTMPAWQDTQQLLAECRAHSEPIAGANTGMPVLAPGIRDAIRLRNVRVCFPGRDTPALSLAQLDLPARTTTAVMGASAAGKSTLADVLAGLLAPDSGEMQVDGVAIHGAARLAWRAQVAYVPQDTFLFHTSIRDNLHWACPGATDADMLQALQRAAADFVLDLPEGLDTVVGDGGVRMSGGERQRISLARALLRQPSLLILDEATSALDTDNEHRIRRAIEQLHGNLTVVIIGHRLATLEHADQVVVLAGGELQVQGSWSQVRERVEASTA